MQLCGRGLVVLLAALLASELLAQKAEPLRITFARGANSTQVKGTLSGRQDMEYALGAKRGQTLIIRLSVSPANTVTIKVYDPQNNQLTLKRTGNRSSVALPEDGDYGLTIFRVAEGQGSSSFRVFLSIQ